MTYKSFLYYGLVTAEKIKKKLDSDFIVYKSQRHLIYRFLQNPNFSMV